VNTNKLWPIEKSDYINISVQHNSVIKNNLNNKSIPIPYNYMNCLYTVVKYCIYFLLVSTYDIPIYYKLFIY